MVVTFFIGNGFDLNLGLKTTYKDFYPYFCDHAKESNIILNWLKKDDMNWSDLELDLGENLEQLPEGEENRFYDDKEELDNLLLEYLENEQTKVDSTNAEKISSELIRSLVYFDKDLNETNKVSINYTLLVYNKPIRFEFIDFNYTNVLDRIVAITKQEEVNARGDISVALNEKRDNNQNTLYLGNVSHIHGTVEMEAILAVNDESQINNARLQTNPLFLDTFIKSRINTRIGQNKIQKVDHILDESHVVCIFGMSIGDSDKVWWEKLISWLASDEKNKLVIYHKINEDVLQRRNPSRIIRIEYEIREDIFSKGKTEKVIDKEDSIKQRIFIALNSDIFSFN